MKARTILASTSVAVILSMTSLARADESDEDRSAAAFQISLWDSVQIVDRTRSIHGLRLTLPYGSNHDVYGLDVGIVNHSTGDLRGAQFSLGGLVEGSLQGLQYDMVLAVVDDDAAGVQMALYTSAGTLRGAQFGVVNRVKRDTTGAQLALVNVAEADSVGLAVGAVNYARSIEGLQLGLVNVTERLEGVQIGLVNVAPNGFLPVFVIANAAL